MAIEVGMKVVAASTYRPWGSARDDGMVPAGTRGVVTAYDGPRVGTPYHFWIVRWANGQTISVQETFLRPA